MPWSYTSRIFYKSRLHSIITLLKCIALFSIKKVLINLPKLVKHRKKKSQPFPTIPQPASSKMLLILFLLCWRLLKYDVLTSPTTSKLIVTTPTGSAAKDLSR